MKLNEILRNISGYEIKGSKEVFITGVSANSKCINPGNLFIAKKGKSYDGRHYIPEAIKAGAVAVTLDAFDPSFEHIVQIIHPQVAAIESSLVANYYQNPSHELFTIGITGTNGKTTASFIIKNLLDQCLGTCGLIGTIEYVVGNHRYKASHTTPDVASNHKLLKEMLTCGCKAAVMEVTSHALDQGRVDKIDYDVAIFSNLTQDHLDYHGSMEKYALAKKALFARLDSKISAKKTPKWAIVNQDSTWASYMLEGCNAHVLSYGIDQPADLQASEIYLDTKGTKAKITYQGRSLEAFWPLVGRFNVYNCLTAIAVGLTQNIPLEKILYHMEKIPFIRGRLQPVPNALGLKIYIDFAHSDDALLNVLKTLKEFQSNARLIVVFGCGGDRDQTKRPKMARVCEAHADLCIVTTDNPRSEDPNQICQDIVSGFSDSRCYQVEIDRKLAIQKAIEYAKPQDIILIAGKGHETSQIFANKIVEFDDCLVAADICAQLNHYL